MLTSASLLKKLFGIPTFGTTPGYTLHFPSMRWEELINDPKLILVLVFFFTVSYPQLLAFLMDVSDRVEKEPAHSPLVQALENGAAEVVGANWSEKISEWLVFFLAPAPFVFSSARPLTCSSSVPFPTSITFLSSLGDLLLVDLKRFRNYNWSLVVDLLRAARNKV